MRNIIFLILVYFAAQAVVVVNFANGPFTDEAIYITAGKRILEGFAFQYGAPDSFYWKWFQGSPYLWPILASKCYALGGLVGVRLFAAVLSTLTVLLFVLTWRRVFGERAAFWGAIAIALNGHFFALGHFAVYDTLALLLLALSAFCIASFGSSPKVAEVAFAAMVFSLAVMTKYGFVIAAPAVCGMIYLNIDRRYVARSLLVFSGVTLLLLSFYCLSVFGAKLPGFSQFYTSQAKYFSSEVLFVRLAIWLALPFALSIGGLSLSEMDKPLRWWIVLALPMGLIVASHVVTNMHVSAHKHIVIGLWFLYPFVGLMLERFEKAFSPIAMSFVVAMLALAGSIQWYQTEHSWPNPSPTTQFLASKWQMGDTMVAEDAWSHRMILYWTGLVDSPFAVYDAWNIDKGRRDLCAVTWHVGTESEWGTDRVTELAERCGHERVSSNESPVYWMDREGALKKIMLRQVVYRRH